MVKKTKGNDWPANKVEIWPVAKITPYEKNPRIHPKEQIDLLAKSMREGGVTMPILIDEDGTIIAGHGRRLAAIKNGFPNYPVVIARGWTEQRKQAERLKDNQYGLLSSWDQAFLAGGLKELSDGGVDLLELGFSAKALDALLADKQPSKDPDAIPPAPAASAVRPGDIWELGEHRLICGDSTNPETWAALFHADKAAMVFTDPPYGVSYQAPSGDFAIIEGDKKRRDDLYKMLLGAFKCMVAATDDGAAFYIWHASSTRQDFTDAMTAAGIIERQYILWVKPNIALGHADYRWQHEPCFYASKGDRSPSFYGDRSNPTVWHIAIGANDIAATVGTGVVLLDGKGGTLYVQSKVPKAKKVRQIRIAEGAKIELAGSDRADGTVWEVSRDFGHVHPTQKPVELARRAIDNSSIRGEIVADGFAGAGSTIIAAEQTGRRCYAIELDAHYCHQAIERWQTYAGKTAMLEGKTLEEVRAARDSRKSVPGKGRNGAGKKQKVRARVHARRAAPGREPAGQPPAVAGDS